MGHLARDETRTYREGRECRQRQERGREACGSALVARWRWASPPLHDPA